MFRDGHLAEKSRHVQTRTRGLYDASEAFWVALDFSGVRARHVNAGGPVLYANWSPVCAPWNDENGQLERVTAR